MKSQQVEKLLEACERAKGNYSVMYPIVKDRLGEYTEEELFGAQEIMFFEERYLKGLKHMYENGIHGHILDIGCQFGFQSELFLDEESYTGVDVFRHRFFNQDIPNISYQIGSYPNQLSFDVSKYIVFSSMSLGYFPIRGEDGKIQINTNDDGYVDVFVEALRECNHLYISSTEEVLNRLKEIFSKQELLDENVFPGGPLHKPSRFDMYYFGKE
ncbi:class I SAM-dependent methyltransferase (plasmid) [Brevibacillus halotolerans]|nr:class I SAM-dependent methyltransferase [Brevibacillus halotolerans]